MQNPGDFPACYAIIVAGGSGNRMQNPVPKQFLELAGKPVLMHTLAIFSRSRFAPEIIVVLPDNLHPHWKKLCEKHSFSLAHQLARGGASRFHSVKSGIALIPDDALVAVHDAARPLVSSDLIDRCFVSAHTFGSGIAALPATDTVRVKDGRAFRQLKREEVFLMQTPQTFRSTDLRLAYACPYTDDITDDACVWERSGREPVLVAGEQHNLKITFPADLPLAEFLLTTKKPY